MLFTPLPVTAAGSVAGVTSGTANGTNWGQRYVGTSPLVETTTTATSDVRIAGFRYSATGSLRVRDCTSGVPATTNVGYNGIRLDTDGRACYTAVAHADIGSAFLWHPGVAANVARTGDSVPISVTGDIAVVWEGALDSYAPATVGVLVSKWATGQFSFELYVTTDGKLHFAVFTIGTQDQASTNALTTSAYIPTNLAATRIAASGLITLLQSSDGVTWTSIGSGTQGTGAITDGTADLIIGGNDEGGTGVFPISGKTTRARLYSGIPTFLGGTAADVPVFDAQISGVAEGSTSFTESSSNAATVTVATSGASPAFIYSPRIVSGMAVSGDGRFFMTTS